MNANELTRLLPYRRGSSNARVRLLCLPFAGGTAAAYRTWQSSLPESIDVCAIELPGHGLRVREPPISNMTALCEYLCSTLQPLLDTKVVLFGHSLGARIAFHVASRVAGTAGLVVSAAPAAHLPPRRQRAQLSGPALLEALRVLGGTPLQVLNDEELMSVFLPGIRADFTLLEQGLAKPDQMLNCPILSLCTRDDHEVKFEDVAAWEQRTTADFRLRELSGGHFYLQEQRENILSEVVNCVERWL